MVKNDSVGPLTVAGYLKKCIEASGKSVAEVERRIDARHRIRLQPILDGKVKLPLPVVHVVAQALDVPPLTLLRIWVHDYVPEMEEALFDCGRLMQVSPNEQRIIEAYRSRVADEEHELMIFEDPRFVLLAVREG